MLIKLIPSIIKLSIIGALIYGGYLLFNNWPVETIIGIGIIITFIIVKWLIDLEHE